VDIKKPIQKTKGDGKYFISMTSSENYEKKKQKVWLISILGILMINC
jgi:hypothetical protein